jgi:hypothetical protein
LIAVLPGLAASFALVKLINYAVPNSISAQQSCMIAPSIVYFLAVASGATYLSQAYLAARSVTDEGTHPVSSPPAAD